MVTTFSSTTISKTTLSLIATSVSIIIITVGHQAVGLGGAGNQPWIGVAVDGHQGEDEEEGGDEEFEEKDYRGNGMGLKIDWELGVKFGRLTAGEEDDVVKVEFVVGKVDDGRGEGGHLVGEREVSVVVVLVV